MTSYYRGVRFQRGYGLGNTLKRLYRVSLPAVKLVSAVAKTKLLNTSANVLKDMARGKNLKDALRARLIPTGRRPQKVKKTRRTRSVPPGVRVSAKKGKGPSKKKKTTHTVRDIFHGRKL